jgi:uncharacterized protein (DUF3820 family)
MERKAQRKKQPGRADQEHVDQHIKNQDAHIAKIMSQADHYTIMTWGKHKGKPLSEVPHSWFEWFYFRGKLSGDIKQYAEENVPIIRFSVEKEAKKKAEG